MKHKLQITNLYQFTQLTENILRTVASFNCGGQPGVTIYSLAHYVESYNRQYPKGIFDYTTHIDGDTIDIFADGVLALSLTMCEVNELVVNENY